MALTAIEVEANVTVGKFASGEINADFFGANFLLGSDSFSGMYAEKIEKLGVTTLRYPGGAIAEKYFDITDPNNVAPSTMGTFDTLSVFLNYCSEFGHRPSVVIPTGIYAADISQGVAEVSKFIEELSAGIYGPTDGLIIEIGNEYHAPTPNLTADQYGEIASKFAVAIKSTASIDIEVAVQIGGGDSDYITIASYFDEPAEINAIDMLIIHDYSWTEAAIEGRFANKFARIEHWKEKGIDPEIFMSEWNIGNHKNSEYNDRHDYGLAQASALIEYVSEAIKAGVDISTVWAIQQGTRTALTENAGDAKINFGGVIYEMMAKTLVGSRVLDISEDVFFDGALSIHAFENAEQIIVFVSAGDFDETSSYIDVDIDLSGFGSSFSSVSAERLYTDGDPNDWRANALVDQFAPDIQNKSGGIMNVTFGSDHEVVKLVFTKTDIGNIIVICDGMASSETIMGGNKNDRLNGRGGDDKLYGLSGDDKVVGNRGNDTIYGGAGDDHMVGGPQDDELFGEAGNDRLNGGRGQDKLYGGGGDDRLVGGKGDDQLTGGGGADTFIFREGDGNDVVTDFELGADRIVLKGVLGGQITQTIDANGLMLQYGNDTVFLNNIFETLSDADLII